MSIASAPSSNKDTCAEIVSLDNPRITAENILTLGQSGLVQSVGGSPVLDPHFRDQFDLYRSFQYKPMRLYQNTQPGVGAREAGGQNQCDTS